MERKRAFASLDGRKRQRMLELEKITIDFQRELEQQKKQKLEKLQAQISKITLTDNQDIDFMQNVSR